jgi:hypothetical protein
MKRSFITLLLTLAGLLAAAEVRAEAFLDIYAGGAFTSDARSHVLIPPKFENPPNPDPRPNFIIRRAGTDTAFEDSVSYGMRAGYWFGPWFGVALDAFTFEPNLDAENFTTDDTDVRAIPISLLLMLRWPLLASEEYPLGRLHPYVGGGPSLFITEFEGDVDLSIFDFTRTEEPAGEFSSRKVDPGMALLVGLDFQILPFVGVFGEYRYTLAEPVWHDTVLGVGDDPPTITADFSVPLRTHHIVGGITFRF